MTRWRLEWRRRGGMVRWVGWLVVVFALALAGCAAPAAYREGKASMALGQPETALAHFERAVALEPGSAEYRIAYLRTRDRLLLDRLNKADQARDRAEWVEAEQAYRAALAIPGGQERALAGLRAVERFQRQDQQVKQARQAGARKDWDEVWAISRALLTETPGHPAALELMRSAEKARDAASPSAAKSLSAAYRKPISIEFRDATLKTVFEVISKTSGLNFVLDKEIRNDQRTSVFLKNSTVEAAVATVLATNQLEQRILDANSVLIYPNTPAKQKEYQTLVVRSFYLANAEAKVVAATLKSLLKLREAVVDEKLNLVIVRDSAEAVRVAERVVALHDVPEAEVMLEVEILEVKRSRLLDLGVRWPEQLELVPLGSGGGGALTLADLRSLNSGTIGASLGSLSIRAKKTDSDANILANPRIRARNREKAKIHIGERVPNITTTSTSSGFVSESVSYVDVGLKLDVEPTVYLDNEVAIKISLEVSNIINQIQTKSGTLAYQIGTRTASTVLRLRDGENQVLAGLINDEDRRSGNKVPFIGEVPVLGRLFGNQVDDAAKTEIILSITPRILRNVRRPDTTEMEFDSGTEAAVGGALPAVTQAPTASGVTTSALPQQLKPPASDASGSGAGSVATSSAAGPSGAMSVNPGTAAPTPVMTLRVDGPSSVRVGEPFELRIHVIGGTSIVSIPVMLGFDPARFEILGVTDGGFLGQAGAQVRFTSQVDAKGTLAISANQAGNGASGDGILAIVSIRGLKADGQPGALQLLSATPGAAQGRPIAVQLGPPLAVFIKQP